MPDDAALLNGLQANKSWNLFFNHPNGAVLGLYTATMYLPAVLAAYIGDVLSHRFGRRIALGLGSFIVLAGGLINAFASNPAMWLAGNLFCVPDFDFSLTLAQAAPSWVLGVV